MKSFTHVSIRTVGVLLTLVCAIWTPVRLAFAHPLGNFSINHYNRIELSSKGVAVLYVLDLAEIPAFQLKQRIDTDGDGIVEEVERRRYIATKTDELLHGVTLSMNGRRVPLEVREPHLQFAAGQGGLETLRLEFWLATVEPASILGVGEVAFHFRNANERDRLGWREIVLRVSDGVKVTASDVSGIDVSDELRNYPQDLLNSPLSQTEASFTVITRSDVAQGNDAPSSARPGFGAASRDSQFAALIGQRDLTLPVILLSLLTALGLGALHALEPGHGKSVAAAYLVGSRATPRHAVLLGGTVTVTHTASVFAMGLVTLFLSAYIVPERLFPYLGLLSAGIVLAIGVHMIVSAVRDRAVVEDHTHTFDAAIQQLSHMHGGRAHTHKPPARLDVQGVLAVGVSGGLVPCPAALIVLLSAIALGRIGFGLLLIVTFSVGLAGVLVAISLAVVYGKRALARSSRLVGVVRMLQNGWLARTIPLLSAMLVVGAGLLLLYYTLPFLSLR